MERWRSIASRATPHPARTNRRARPSSSRRHRGTRRQAAWRVGLHQGRALTIGAASARRYCILRLKETRGVYRAEARRRRAKDGGPDRDRTGDLLNAIQARSQLRYRPPREEGYRNPRRVTQATAVIAGARSPGNACMGGIPRFARNLVPLTWGGGRLRRPGRDQRQPVGQLARRILRGRAVERHQRGRHPWQARDLRPPARGRHRQHLDDIVASGNAVLEALSVHRFVSGDTGVAIVVIQPARSSEATHEGRARNHSGEKLPGNPT